MTVQINALTFNKLTAQPYGYEESNTRRGFTSRRWAISGLLTPAEWLSLLDIYNTWRDNKITEADPVVSGSVGSSVILNFDGPGGQDIDGVACWFSTAPSAEQNGAFLSVSVELVDANQALQVAELEAAGEEEDLVDLGNIIINGATIKLLKPKDTYEAPATMELTAAGRSYVSGPWVAVRVEDIEGDTDLDGWDRLRTWYENTVVSTPAPGTWFPTSAPTATASRKLVNGVVSTVYTVSITRARAV